MPCTASHLRLAVRPKEQLEKLNRIKSSLPPGGQVTLEHLSTPVKLNAAQLECAEFLRSMGLPARDRTAHRSTVLRTAGGKQQALLQPKDLDRLRNAARVVTVDERLDTLKSNELEGQRLEKESEELRQHFKRIDEARKRAQEANAKQQREESAMEKLAVLERSFLAKHEQEEDVKRATRLMLNAKCHAVQDAQIQERAEIERANRGEEMRLGKMVLEGANKALKEEDEREERRKAAKIKYAQEIRKQLSERENLRFLEAERVEQEARMIRRAREALKVEDQRQAEMAKERRLKLRAELQRIAEMSAMFKKMLCEQEREADMRVAAYMREKQDHERALQAEKKLGKEAAEKRQQRIFMLSQKLLEARTTSEELSYLREQEKMEREYRRTEKEAALRKKQIEKDLADARERQLQEIKHRQALQIAREEKEFNMLIEKVKEAEEKEKQREQDRERASKCFREAIIKQMNDKELERRRLIDLERAQAYAWRESERQRDSNIRTVINAKLEAMREACLPEKYIKEVEKQLRKISNKTRISE